MAADPATGSITLSYRFADVDGTSFIERIQLPERTGDIPPESTEFASAARILLLLAGVSYYKSQAPTEIVVEVPTTTEERALVATVYDHGLREFAYSNDLPIPLVQNFVWSGGHIDSVPAPDRPDAALIGRPLVPFGGGKDSTVVLSLLPEGTPITVNGTSTHNAVAAALGHELVSVSRQLGRLNELTSPDRLNGHIPITAIVSAIGVLLAARDGFSSVVMANEEAASEPTLWADGEPVNHQWSKGAQFEALFADALAAAGLSVRYFSWLREVSEPKIIALLSKQTAALPLLISCNRAFAGRTAGSDVEAPQRWCGECPKCLFTYLLLATELPPDVLVPIFGNDLLANPSLTPLFAELWSDEKPFECVGERADAARAMLRVARDTRWAGRAVPADLAARAAAALAAPETSRESGAGLLVPGPPTPFLRRMSEALGALGP